MRTKRVTEVLLSVSVRHAEVVQPCRWTELPTDHLDVVSDLPHSARLAQAEGNSQQKDGELGSGPMTTRATELPLAD